MKYSNKKNKVIDLKQNIEVNTQKSQNTNKFKHPRLIKTKH